MSLSASAELLARTLAAVGQAIEQRRDVGERAAAIAAALRLQWPAASLTACLLRDGDGWLVAALDPDGRPRPDWDDPLRDAVGGGKAPRLPSPVAVEPLRWRGREYGHLAVGIADVRPMLDALADATAAHLAADELLADLTLE